MAMTVNPWAFAADIIKPHDDKWKPLVHQLPPNDDYFVFAIIGGRGCGKTATLSRMLHEHAMGPPCLPHVKGGHWIGIIAPTIGDAVTSVVDGPSGLRCHDPGLKLRQTVGGTKVTWSNGAEAKIFGAHTPDDVERLRSGGNRCYVAAEELSSWRYLNECWQHMRYGLRVGPHPRVMVATTPKTRPLIKKLFKDSKDPKNRIVIKHATTNDNPHLPDNIKEELYRDYAGTRLGRQELEGLLIEDVQGALWSSELIDQYRLRYDDIPDKFDQVVVAVDPQAKLLSDVTGIIVVGIKNRWTEPGIMRPDQAHGFVLGDYSIGGRPEVWAKSVKRAYRDFRANYVVAEVNNGGEMVKSTIHTADPTLPVTDVWASRGKAIRAEPVSYLYEQGRIHHVGDFPQLEDNMTSWDASDPPTDWSPDRMDAMVWGFSKTLVSNAMMSNSQVNDKRLEGRR